uniref:Uncharacterized protein n=1 Tax=Candidatus Kentrum sp. MB TaxID=2138164 RepID=A0A450XTB3_9GAMM|nr:MAG: hypothetical protein BECKMB1821I_GA0114274_103416 [Candidatus Kentron sp. MB]VFK75963.1 MAG: hypothetical protein BECKMB1821H_GA0114242_103716 [Candidatus Kentron sp. MB]
MIKSTIAHRNLGFPRLPNIHARLPALAGGAGISNYLAGKVNGDGPFGLGFEWTAPAYQLFSDVFIGNLEKLIR